MNQGNKTYLPVKEIFLIITFLLFAFLLRFSSLSMITSFSGDEAMHIASAKNYTERGYFGPDNWYHPPLKHIFLYASIRGFGDNPYGWRMRNVIFGALTIIPLYFLTKKLSSSIITASCASLLLVTDPLHILFSRTTFEDIPALFFMLSGLLFSIKYLEEKNASSSILLSGISFGLAISLRLYFIPVLIIVLIIVLIKSFKMNEDGFSFFFNTISSLLIIPITIYLLIYYPWFRRGYSISEWVLMQLDAFREMTAVRDFHPLLMELSGPWRWFIKFIGLGFNIEAHNGSGRYVIVMNNIVTWILVIPSILYQLINSIRQHDKNRFLISLIFIVLYLSYLTTKRPVFLYTAISILPFGFIAVSELFERLIKEKAIWVFLPLLLWSLYLYPLVIGMEVPVWLYSPILNLMKVFRPQPW